VIVKTTAYDAYLNDATATKISGYKEADYILRQLADHHPRLDMWQQWAKPILADYEWFSGLQQTMEIAYARMAHRQGSLSTHPRSYHNEFHCNDLLSHLISCQQKQASAFNAEALAMLSFFAVCHDLQQGLPKHQPENSLAGTNEIVSYLEARRIIEETVKLQTELNSLWNDHYLLLLKIMIEGSTFGNHSDNKRYFFQGNRVLQLLDEINLISLHDIQWVLFACDIDTANVSLELTDYARSAIRVFDELKAHQLTDVSAHHFFSTEQINYFFKQQQFHSDLAKQLFQPKKQRNGPLLQQVVAAVEALPETADTDTVKHTFFTTAQQLSTS